MAYGASDHVDEYIEERKEEVLDAGRNLAADLTNKVGQISDKI